SQFGEKKRRCACSDEYICTADLLCDRFCEKGGIYMACSCRRSNSCGCDDCCRMERRHPCTPQSDWGGSQVCRCGQMERAEIQRSAVSAAGGRRMRIGAQPDEIAASWHQKDSACQN